MKLNNQTPRWAQAIFHRIEEPASYGNGKYQDQEDKPVHARN